MMMKCVKLDSLNVPCKGSVDEYSTSGRFAAIVGKADATWNVDELMGWEGDADMTRVVILGARIVKVPRGALHAVTPTSTRVHWTCRK